MIIWFSIPLFFIRPSATATHGAAGAPAKITHRGEAALHNL
jgi:hypothetical protein